MYSFYPELVFELVAELVTGVRSCDRSYDFYQSVLTRNKELVDDKLRKQALQKGLLLEFKKDVERILLDVGQKPDGRRNWIVFDQNGVTTSIKPQQITIPHSLSLLGKLLEGNKSVTAEDLAEMIFGGAEPVESYCAHLLLSRDEVYFTVLDSKGSSSIYGSRSTAQGAQGDREAEVFQVSNDDTAVAQRRLEDKQPEEKTNTDCLVKEQEKEYQTGGRSRRVEEMKRRIIAKEAADKEYQEFIQLLKSAKAMPPRRKPSKSSWKAEDKVAQN
ncbi:hypothetical protein Tco_1200463 [Tanacetum coccineum]